MAWSVRTRAAGTRGLWLAPPAAAVVILGFSVSRVAALEEWALLLTSVATLVSSHAVLHSRRRQVRAEEEAKAIRANLKVRSRAAECERQRQSLDSFAQLAARVAHEVRNPLTAIELNLEMLEDEFTDCGCKRGPIVSDLVRSMRDETRRLREFSDEYLAFARPPRPALLVEDLREVAEDLAGFVREEALRGGVTIHAHGGPVPVLARIDRHQVKQAALNLVKNAIQAMPRGGRIDLTTDFADGGARLTVADTGTGLPAEIRCKIFQPFFSTKAGGTGLGLPVALHVAREHGGDIRTDDRVGGGTVFTMSFPALAQGVSPVPRDSLSAAGEAQPEVAWS